MPFKGEDFQYTRGEAYAEITQGVYGEEYERATQDLINLENGVRAHWAEQLRKLIARGGEVGTSELCDLLDPYSGIDGPEGTFARTYLDTDKRYEVKP